MNFQFNVRFETIDDNRVRAYVNDEYMGGITFKIVRVKVRESTDAGTLTTYEDMRRLCYRGPGTAFKRTLPARYPTEFERFATVDAALAETKYRDQMIAIVLHDAIVQRSILNRKATKPKLTFDECVQAANAA